jgi:hypothetical protein
MQETTYLSELKKTAYLPDNIYKWSWICSVCPNMQSVPFHIHDFMGWK